MVVYLWSKFMKKIRCSSIRNSNLHKTSKVEAGCHILNTNFDRYSYCGYDCKIYNTDIGSFCSIADFVTIGGNQHPMEWVSTSPVFQKGRNSVKIKYSEFEYDGFAKTTIGHDVWIGEKVLIKQGVKIGNGAVIGMGSVVTKDVEPYTIVAGNPAKIIRKRFDEEIIKKLLEIKWWDFDDKKLFNYAKYIKNPQEFIKRLDE